MTPVPEKKATPRRLTISQNLEIAELLHNGHHTPAVMRQSGIAGRTVRKIKATAPELLRVASEKPKSLQMKTRQSVLVPHVELNLLEFLNFAKVWWKCLSMTPWMFLETVQVVQNPPKMQSSDEDESAIWGNVTVNRQTIPHVVGIAKLFGELELLTTECQVPDALSHLRSAKRAFLTAKRNREPTRSRQMLITECMQIGVTTTSLTNAVSQ